MDTYDFKKAYKELYSPGKTPCSVYVGPMKFIAVDGSGDPNREGGEYMNAVQTLYSLTFTIKMSPLTGHNIDGYFKCVVPPLEGFWQMKDGRPGVDYSDKSGFEWTSLIRQPDFVTDEVFEWAKNEAARKKGTDSSRARLVTIEEGLCAQIMHHGPYDDEPATVEVLERFIEENGFRPDFQNGRRHHEIYLGDPRRTAPEKLRTVIRHPIAKI